MFKFQSSAPKAPQHSHFKVKADREENTGVIDPQVKSTAGWIWHRGVKKTHSHVFLGEVYEVLQIDVVPVGPNVVVDEEVELVLDPVFEHKGQHAGGQLQKEDDPQEHGELQRKSINTALNTQLEPP